MSIFKSALTTETMGDNHSTKQVYDYALEFMNFVNVNISKLDKIASSYGDSRHFDYELFVSDDEYSGEFIRVNFYDGCRHLLISGVAI